ncbi:hypothetical protein [Mesorhizobium sp. M0802]|uniref:hypothetical protein n=1 Tax=Mesorhizobium sp. M0802 TaxID=2957001 RepID=UPI00333A2453
MSDQAGSVTIQITANTTAFEAALARAKQQASTFDAQISAQLSGAGVSQGLAKIAAGVEQTNALLTKMTGAAGTSAAAFNKLAGDATHASAAISGVNASTVAAASSVGKIASEVSTASASLQRAVSVNQSFAASNAQLSAGGKLASFELRNLQFQMIDIAQSIPMAFQSPLYFLQNLGFQFAQIGQIFMGKGGLRAAVGEMGSMVGSILASFSRLAAGAAGALAGIATGGLVLGFNSIRDAASEAEHRTVGFGETFKAIFQTIGGYIQSSSLGTVFNMIADGASYAFEKLGSAAVDIAELVINSFHAAYVDIVAGWRSFPDQLGAFFVGAANNGIAALNMLVKKASDAVDEISKALNNIPGVDIPLLNAGDQAIKPLNNKYLDNLKKEVADRNAEIERIMKSSPLRTFASDVVDQIATNHALEGLDALKNISFGNATSGANGFSSAIGGIGSAANGVTVQFGGMSQQVVNVSRAFADAKLAQMAQIQGTTNELHKAQSEAAELQKTLAAASQAKIADVFGKGFAGDTNAATEAVERNVNAIHRLFAAYGTGNAGTLRDFQNSLDMLRQTLLAQGGDPVAINAFFDSIVSGEIKVRQLNSTVNTLHDSITNLPNKTVTITVVTRQVGSGTQSLYDVGGGSTVGVTRYGAAPGSQSGPSMTSTTVPRTGYGSQGGFGGGGTSTVGVTRFSSTGSQLSSTPIFNTSTNSWGYTQPTTYQDPRVLAQVAAMYPQRAAGGPISAHMPYWVGERGPELVMPQSAGTVIPNAQSVALANPQSAFTGQVATRETDRMWTVQMNIEANTRKTSQLLDDIKVRSASSGFGSGLSSGGGSSGASSAADADPLHAAYMKALATWRSNYAAIGGVQPIGYGLDRLAATPEQIARRQVYGFATGGIDSSDTEHVEFFKSPGEKVIIARPDQFADVRPGNSNTTTAGADQRPIVQTFNVRIDAQGGNVSRESQAALRAQFAAIGRDMARSINGR